MKRFIIYTLFICAAFSTLAQGWQYKGDDALLASNDNYITGDFDKPTRLCIFVGYDRENDIEHVVMLLQGECDISNFRQNQMYVVVSFDYEKEQRWRIKKEKVNGNEFAAFSIVNTTAFIKHLQNAESIRVTLPIFQQGTQTFYFSANGYPLDW